ncbi:Peptidase M16C associated protein, partial [human gut metagenome]
YGDMNIEEQLAFLNDEYLSHFDAIEVHTEVALQAPFTEGKVVSYPYSVGSEEPTDNRTLHSFAYVLPDVTPQKSLSRRANSMLFKEASNNSLSKPLSHSSCKIDSTIRCKSA